MIGQKSVLWTFILAGHNPALFELAGPFLLASQLTPLRHRNVDSIIVFVAIDLSIRMVSLATWRSIAIAAGAALIVAAPVARITI